MQRALATSMVLLTATLAAACITVAPPEATGPAPTLRGAIVTSRPQIPPQATSMPPPTVTAKPGSTPATSMPSAAAGASPEAQRVAWKPCEGDVDCATLEVPIDYEDPGKGTVELALVRHRADIPHMRIGSLVMNPGGPGGSGVDWVRSAWSSFGPELTDRFDIVGFDPRGIGRSEAIHCLDTRPALTDAFPENAAEEDDFVDLAKSVTQACERNSGELLPYVGTDNVARDLDQMRAALGDDKLTYYGFSYGTFIGATYADMFPDRIRKMVLDGPVDPTLDFAEFVNTQSAATQAELDEFLAACSEASTCSFGQDDNPAQSFDALLDKFEEGPIDGVTASVALSAVYQELTIDDDSGLETLLAFAEQGITSPLALAGSWATDARLLDGYDAVNCLDYPMPRTADGFAQVAEAAAEVAPDVGAWNTYTYFDCAFWPAEATRTPAPITAEGAPAILVVAATGDPATPYEWGASLADQLSSAVLVTRDGDGHTSFHFSSCVRDIATTYLLTLTVPADGTTCT